MLDIGWSELFVIGVVALVVIGPKDLPEMFRTMGRFTAKARSMARDFQKAMDAAANETGVKDVANDLKSVTSAKSLGLNAVQDAAKRFEAWEPLKKTAQPAPAVAVPPVIPPAAGIGTSGSNSGTGPATAALAQKRMAETAALKDLATRKAAAKPASSGGGARSGTPPASTPETGSASGSPARPRKKAASAQPVELVLKAPIKASAKAPAKARTKTAPAPAARTPTRKAPAKPRAAKKSDA